MRHVYFIERMTVLTWSLSMLPHLVWRRLSGGHRGGRCEIIDGSWAALAVARASAWLAGLTVQRCQFRLADARDEQGLLIRLKLAYQDLADVQHEVMSDPLFRQIVDGKGQEHRHVAMYLAKSIANMYPLDSRTMWRALLLVHICRWKVRTEPRNDGLVPILLLERRPWRGAIQRHARRYGVEVVMVTPAPCGNLRLVMRQIAGAKMFEMLRMLRSRLSRVRVAKPVVPSPQSRLPRVAVEHSGYFNVKHPEQYSDLFFWQQSSIAGQQVLLVCGSPHSPLTDTQGAQLAHHGIAAVALTPRATPPAVPLFTHWPRLRRSRLDRALLISAPRRVDAKWLREQLADYEVRRDYWAALFAACGAKIFLSFEKSDRATCAIADALQRVGGISAVYQRSYEANPSAETAVSADVAFGFSTMSAAIERQSGSQVRYYITSGYLGDHRFALLRQQAAQVRQALQRHGATRTLAFFDENSLDDARWQTGHEFMQQNYAFLLERLLAEPWLGLVVKPKAPYNLRRRLGPVAPLLKQAEATGRCYLYESGCPEGLYPPAAASLAADVAIHGHLWAATAGVESALAGVPTLLVDREGWHVSPFYRLGVGRVVFSEWPALWQTCVEHWSHAEGVPGFGDWSLILDELDPFRDGQAARRMGTYLQGMLEGFTAGLDRETIMADAAQRYAARWGRDKVTQITGDGRAVVWGDQRMVMVGT